MNTPTAIPKAISWGELLLLHRSSKRAFNVVGPFKILSIVDDTFRLTLTILHLPRGRMVNAINN